MGIPIPGICLGMGFLKVSSYFKKKSRFIFSVYDLSLILIPNYARNMGMGIGDSLKFPSPWQLWLWPINKDLVFLKFSMSIAFRGHKVCV